MELKESVGDTPVIEVYETAQGFGRGIQGSANPTHIQKSKLSLGTEKTGEDGKSQGIEQNGKPNAPHDNPISRLQEKCMKAKLPPPEYELVEATGQPHNRKFVVQISIGKFVEKAESRSKKSAKRLAAEKMLASIHSQQENSQPFANDEAELIQRFKTVLRPLGVRPLTKTDIQHVEAFFAPIRAKTPEAMRPVKGRQKESKGGDEPPLWGTITPGEAIGILNRIAEEHRFRVAYTDLDPKRTDGKYHCLVQLSTMPVAVCYGEGKTREAAQQGAAFCALHYLRTGVDGTGGLNSQ